MFCAKIRKNMLTFRLCILRKNCIFAFMENMWILRQLSTADRLTANKLAAEINQSAVMGELLVARGIRTFEQARNFFRPDLNMLHDPMLMKDMDKAVERLTRAVINKETIMVYGDYDVDGITAVALVYTILIGILPKENLRYYIPNRDREGYGVSIAGIDEAARRGATLMITLDCGIKAVDKVAYAHSKGIDVIICDHHQVGDELPEAVAVLDPKRSDCEYPYKELSGCGVGFKLMQAFAQKNGIELQNNKDNGPTTPLFHCLDLLALSIASDIVPITGENRILAYHGMKQINSNRASTGVKGLLKVCGLTDESGKLTKEITITDIVFKVGPRLNASGRLHEATEAVELLVNHNEEKIQRISKNINDYNSERKTLDSRMTEEAKKQVYADPDHDKKKAIVVYNPEWTKGVVGIVASRLCEEFYKPVVVLTRTQNDDENSDFVISGSARSVGGFDLYAAIDSCSDILLNWGGHTYAAGLSMKEDKLTDFAERFEKYVAQHITEEQQKPLINIDAELHFSDIIDYNNKFWNVLKQFEPFGPGNTKPIFVTRGVSNVWGEAPVGGRISFSKLVGAEKKHLKLIVTDGSCYKTRRGADESSQQAQINGIGFNMWEFFEPLVNGIPLDVCYQLEENHFRDKKSLQITVKDIKISE